MTSCVGPLPLSPRRIQKDSGSGFLERYSKRRIDLGKIEEEVQCFSFLIFSRARKSGRKEIKGLISLSFSKQTWCNKILQPCVAIPRILPQNLWLPGTMQGPRISSIARCLGDDFFLTINQVNHSRVSVNNGTSAILSVLWT